MGRIALAVGLARRAQRPYALRRLTVRRSTSTAESNGWSRGRAVTRAVTGDRALTKGYAMARRARQAGRLIRRPPDRTDGPVR
ncbi:hypothetical protein HTV45_13065 [Streptomyces sp. CHD11]|nr:hypothetical protein [Streptomyces sp. CHD11]